MSSRARAVEQMFEKIFRLAIDKRRPFGYDRFMDTVQTQTPQERIDTVIAAGTHEGHDDYRAPFCCIEFAARDAR